MKIWYSPYELQPLRALNRWSVGSARKGSLLKFEFSHGAIGYADCHPWVELGDLPLKEQLQSLQKGMETPLLRQSLWFAERDSEARSHSKNLFEKLKIPSSHFSLGKMTQVPENLLEEKKNEGFGAVKVKLDSAWREQLKFLQPWSRDFHWRFDFNFSLDLKESNHFYQALRDFDFQVDFIEDPFPFDTQEWNHFSQRTGAKLALDHHRVGFEGEGYQLKVYKPAIEGESVLLPLLLKAKQSIFVTSYMDHPLGQISAAFIAACLHRDHPKKFAGCGLLTHSLYESNAFSEILQSKGPELLPVDGNGFGFDHLLEGQTWKRIEAF